MERARARQTDNGLSLTLIGHTIHCRHPTTGLNIILLLPHRIESTITKEYLKGNDCRKTRRSHTVIDVTSRTGSILSIRASPVILHSSSSSNSLPAPAEIVRSGVHYS